MRPAGPSNWCRDVRLGKAARAAVLLFGLACLSLPPRPAISGEPPLGRHAGLALPGRRDRTRSVRSRLEIVHDQLTGVEPGYILTTIANRLEAVDFDLT